MTILVDTDILVDVGHGLPAAVDFLEQVLRGGEAAISVITQMELLVGCRTKREQRAVQRFVIYFEIIPIEARICKEAVSLLERYRLSHGLLIPDALIAATALVHGLPLVSGNIRDYQFIEGLQLQGRPYSAG